MKKDSDTISKYMLHTFSFPSTACAVGKAHFYVDKPVHVQKPPALSITSTLHPLVTVCNTARTAGVAVQASQWPLWKTCYQTGRPTCATTLPVD